ncbi:class I SAM-dependent methyltransferase [Sphingomonas sp. 2R-10]|uniref:class I SAM-dependent methyltransferase n=1 Tax=Sphingomonas sp. 2R-10 TaxID=3045148 RepID=UPI0024B957A6|nr:class I SAM-dependent methyltransferase [Sphingomonas sp. 2R-10]MDJ0276074.1 class I SAM-dependent methyltransferase [Sphingomonas sp. 2R-10]
MENAFDVGDRARAELADLIDRQMRPLGDAVFSKLPLAEGQTVMDVGCGTGEATLQLAALVGPQGQVIGVDVAPRVLALAKRRAENTAHVTFLQDDAGTLPLPDRSLDVIFSRFGTMFFADPVAAFRNLHRMLRPGGNMGFVCWRSVAENELDTFCINAAKLPITVDTSPYSFEKAAVIKQVLEDAGFRNIAIEAHDAPITAGDTASTLKVVTRVGALGKSLRENPDLLPAAEPIVRSALAAREQGGLVHLNSATWIVTATA